MYVSCSIGISIYPKDGHDANTLLKHADTAMYKSKASGRNNYHFYHPKMTLVAQDKMLMNSNMIKALKNEEFLVYYQPQIETGSGILLGVEALVRWRHRKIGIIDPSKFLPYIEDKGLVIKMDQWVMHEAMSKFHDWHQKGYTPGILALNLTIGHLNKIEFFDDLQNTIRKIGISPRLLEFEITRR